MWVLAVWATSGPSAQRRSVLLPSGLVRPLARPGTSTCLRCRLDHSSSASGGLASLVLPMDSPGLIPVLSAICPGTLTTVPGLPVRMEIAYGAAGPTTWFYLSLDRILKLII